VTGPIFGLQLILNIEQVGVVDKELVQEIKAKIIKGLVHKFDWYFLFMIFQFTDIFFQLKITI
jgi:hypothetical protein